MHDLNLTNELVHRYLLSQVEAKIVVSHAQSRVYEKGEFFLQAPAVCKEIAYVVSGVFRYYTINEDGEEVTAMFMREGDFFTDLESLQGQTPSEGFIQAETNASTCIFSKEANDKLKNQIKGWSDILRMVTKQKLLEQLKFTRQLVTLDAVSAYQSFRSNYPTIVDRVPDQHIASFLGISKFTLSRVKKKLQQQKTWIKISPAFLINLKLNYCQLLNSNCCIWRPQ